MKKLCMFCAKEHRKVRPEECLFKGAVFGALMQSFVDKEKWIAMHVCDKTSFLTIAWTSFQKNRKLKGEKK